MVKGAIYLSHCDLEKYKRHELGHGTDGTVYRFSNSELLKLYHRKIDKISSLVNASQTEDIKIYDPKNIKHDNYNEPLTYFSYNGEDIRLRTKDAIFLAIERQKNIQHTALPQNVAYVDNHFAGCILKTIKGVQIHKLMGLPLSLRIKIIEQIITATTELLDNNIYHIDLANSPYSRTVHERNGKLIHEFGHSHILVNPFTLNAQIIDLEGKSTIYTERFNEEYYHDSLVGLTTLIIEFLLKINYDDYEEELESLEYFLNSIDIDKCFHESIINKSMSLEEIHDFTHSLTLKK